MRMRLLPATIGVSSLLLVSKTLGLILALGPNSWALQDVVVPMAVAAPAAEASHAPANPPAPREAAANRAEATPSKPVRPSDPPPPVVSEEERQLLLDLRARRKQWDARDRALVEREGVLSAAEQRLVARASELAALQTRLEQLEKERADRDDANWAGLVKVYETMKPREAATIFNDMDMPVLLQLADRMKEAKAALIFGAMQPDRARLVTAQLAVKRSRSTTLSDLPSPQGSPHS